MPRNKISVLFGENISIHTLAKPFVKWAGGKGTLLQILESQLPDDFDYQDVTYIEPFVGGGAMLFHMLTTHKNIKRVVINDINKDLIKCYSLIKENPKVLIDLLRPMEEQYYQLSETAREKYYYDTRDEFNLEKLSDNQRAAYLIFLNRTCFRGMYRENQNGSFNVPFGHYKRPKISNYDVIMADHEVLSKVEIMCGDYKNVIKRLGKGYNFIYFDPPYRPLLGSNNFKRYSKSGFGDPEQEELKSFCDKMTSKSCKIMLSNSYSTNGDGSSYFEALYKDYSFDTILAPRYINAYAEKREKQKEILIKNYNNPKMKLPKTS